MPWTKIKIERRRIIRELIAICRKSSINDRFINIIKCTCFTATILTFLWSLDRSGGLVTAICLLAMQVVVFWVTAVTFLAVLIGKAIVRIFDCFDKTPLLPTGRLYVYRAIFMVPTLTFYFFLAASIFMYETKPKYPLEVIEERASLLQRSIVVTKNSLLIANNFVSKFEKPGYVLIIGWGGLYLCWIFYTGFEIRKRRQDSNIHPGRVLRDYDESLREDTQFMVEIKDPRLISPGHRDGAILEFYGENGQIIACSNEFLWELYDDCLTRYSVYLEDAPRLFISRSQADMCKGPHYSLSPAHGPIIIIPNGVEPDIVLAVRDFLGKKQYKPSEYNSIARENAHNLDALKLIIGHELGHDKFKSIHGILFFMGIDLFGQVTKAILPISRCILYLARIDRSMKVSEEAACDFKAMIKLGVSPKLIKLVNENIAVSRAQAIRNLLNVAHESGADRDVDSDPRVHVSDDDIARFQITERSPVDTSHQSRLSESRVTAAIFLTIALLFSFIEYIRGVEILNVVQALATMPYRPRLTPSEDPSPVIADLVSKPGPVPEPVPKLVPVPRPGPVRNPPPVPPAAKGRRRAPARTEEAFTLLESESTQSTSPIPRDFGPQPSVVAGNLNAGDAFAGLVVYTEQYREFLERQAAQDFKKIRASLAAPQSLAKQHGTHVQYANDFYSKRDLAMIYDMIIFQQLEIMSHQANSSSEHNNSHQGTYNHHHIIRQRALERENMNNHIFGHGPAAHGK